MARRKKSIPRLDPSVRDARKKASKARKAAKHAKREAKFAARRPHSDCTNCSGDYETRHLDERGWCPDCTHDGD